VLQNPAPFLGLCFDAPRFHLFLAGEYDDKAMDDLEERVHGSRNPDPVLYGLAEENHRGLTDAEMKQIATDDESMLALYPL
jgi:hypothetical protein